ncbi:MAG: GGDEF domain-containing protein [Methylobacterium frigidaeris]
MSDAARINAALKRPWTSQILEPGLEDGFHRSRDAIWRRTVCAVLASTVVLSLIGLGVDAKAGILDRALALKLGLQIPLLLAGIAAAHFLSVPRPWRLLIPAVPIAATIGVTTLLGLSLPSPFADRYLTVAGLLAFASNLVLPLGLRSAALLCALNLAVYGGLTLLVADGAQWAAFSDVVGFMSVLAVATLDAVRRREWTEKDAFLLRQLNEIRLGELTLVVNELTQIVHQDTLTGVGNRRSFDLRYATAWQAAISRGGWITVMMIDVDHFKLFNDAAGHAAGDGCLRAVATAIARGAKCPLDAVSRYGGEEFALIWPEATREEGEAICRSVEALALRHPGLGNTDCVTISLGMASTVPAAGSMTSEELLKAADDALYQAKRAGRNRAVINGGGNLQRAA